MPYAYNAAMWCDDCAEKVKADLDAQGVEDSGDTNDYPQWCSDSEETDTPQHCDDCHAFLETPLTGDGFTYVAEAIQDAIAARRLTSVAVTEWWPVYRYDLDLPIGARVHYALQTRKEAP